MPNITITNIDRSCVALRDAEFEDGLLTFAGADTLLEGTILARDSVSGKFVPYVVGGVTNENGIPKAVLTYEVTAAGAGDVPVRALISGVVDRSLLVIDADGDGSNLTSAIVDELRSYAIIAPPVSQNSLYDNPQS